MKPLPSFFIVPRNRTSVVCLVDAFRRLCIAIAHATSKGGLPGESETSQFAIMIVCVSVLFLVACKRDATTNSHTYAGGVGLTLTASSSNRYVKCQPLSSHSCSSQQSDILRLLMRQLLYAQVDNIGQVVYSLNMCLKVTAKVEQSFNYNHKSQNH
eukprot:3575012-Amphidinium_carterae.1